MEFIPYHSSSSGNLYSVSSGASTLLLEAGLPGRTIRKALEYRLSHVAGCLVTHGHGDHAKGAADLMKYGVDCYMTAETAKEIGAHGHRLHVIEPLKQFVIDGWTVLPFPAQHDAHNVGFLISDDDDKMVYLNDSFYSKFRFKGVGIYAIGCNYSEKTLSPNLDPARKKRLLTAHMSLEQCVKFFEAQDLSRCREIWLLHISSENGNEVLFIDKIRAATGKPTYAAPI